MRNLARKNRHRWFLAAGILLAASALPALGQWIMNGPGMMVQNADFDDFSSDLISLDPYTAQRMQQQISQLLQNQRDPHLSEFWPQCSMTENNLVAMGPGALPLIQSEMANRAGVPLDELRVAAFRLQHASFIPESLLTDWAHERFPKAVDAGFGKSQPLIIAHVMGIPAGETPFPHHLFYAVQWKPTHERVPVALAEDGMIQPLPDDAALLRFFRNEATPEPTPAGKECIASAALYLAIARFTDLTDFSNWPKMQWNGRTCVATLNASGTACTATLSFAPASGIDSLSTSLGLSPPAADPAQ